MWLLWFNVFYGFHDRPTLQTTPPGLGHLLLVGAFVGAWMSVVDGAFVANMSGVSGLEQRSLFDSSDCLD